MENKEAKILLSWTAPEFVYHPKTRVWLAAMGIIAAGFFLMAVLIKNYFLALLVPIAAFLIYVHAQKRPRQITIKLTSAGVGTEESFSLAYSEISSFWIFEETEIKSLGLVTKKLFQPKILLPLGNQETSIIRNILIDFIKEKKQEEDFTDIIARKLKF